MRGREDFVFCFFFYWNFWWIYLDYWKKCFFFGKKNGFFLREFVEFILFLCEE